VLPLFVWHMNRFQIVPEERALAARLREQYSAYGGACADGCDGFVSTSRLPYFGCSLP